MGSIPIRLGGFDVLFPSLKSESRSAAVRGVQKVRLFYQENLPLLRRRKAIGVEARRGISEAAACSGTYLELRDCQCILMGVGCWDLEEAKQKQKQKQNQNQNKQKTQPWQTSVEEKWLPRELIPTALSRFRKLVVRAALPKVKDMVHSCDQGASLHPQLWPVLTHYLSIDWAEQVRTYRELIASSDLRTPKDWFVGTSSRESYHFVGGVYDLLFLF